MNDKEQLFLSVPADHSNLFLIGSFVEEVFKQENWIKPTRDFVYNLQLGLHELCTNIIEHAYGTETDGDIKIWVEASQKEETIIFEIHDSGCAFDPRNVPAFKFGTLQEKGFGLYLIKQLFDKVSYERIDHINHWHLTKTLDQGA